MKPEENITVRLVKKVVKMATPEASLRTPRKLVKQVVRVVQLVLVQKTN